ncbi:hypothetical protein POM88_009524 [Heracleum sosnowskyi]|uniref:Uncharacterized protein n=1 Tax=Heracleum sosnowskyi TaxID=360622 RepID=A0AAD8N8E8_9APIA|nr:hypothetical protein POM88_009524 [Heracleum sosnowskyi]
MKLRKRTLTEMKYEKMIDVKDEDLKQLKVSQPYAPYVFDESPEKVYVVQTPAMPLYALDSVASHVKSIERALATAFFLLNLLRIIGKWFINFTNTNLQKVSFSSEIVEPTVCDVQTNSLKEPPDKKKLNKPTNMWFKIKEAIYICVIELLEDVTYDEIKVFLRCSKIKDNHQTKKNYEEICVNKGTRSRKWNCCDSYLEDSLVHLILQNLNESPQMLSGKDYIFVTLAKFEQRRENIILKQVDRGKVMKIEKVEHKMFVWDGSQNSKISASVTMIHHFIFFPVEMRVDKDIHAESLTNGLVSLIGIELVSKFLYISCRLNKTKFYAVGAGIFSGITVALYPISVVKTRLQVVSKNSTERNAFSIIRGLLKAEGIPGLYRGFSTVITGAIPVRVIFLTALETTKVAAFSVVEPLKVSEPTQAAIQCGCSH